MIGEIEDRIVQEILKDLRGRKGLRQAFDEIPYCERCEITAEWLQIVREELVR